ncbi:hypothetical protein [Streptosporangium sp. NPDC003464]
MSVHDPAPPTIPRLLAVRAETDPDRPALVADGLGDLTFGQPLPAPAEGGDGPVRGR